MKHPIRHQAGAVQDIRELSKANNIVANGSLLDEKLNDAASTLAAVGMIGEKKVSAINDIIEAANALIKSLDEHEPYSEEVNKREILRNIIKVACE